MEYVIIGLLVLILIPAGIFFTIRTNFLPMRMFKEMIRISVEKQDNEKESISGIQALIISTATRVGTGNMVGVVAAISAGDDEVGQLVADAMEKVSGDGVITIEESKTMQTELDLVEGMQFDRGYLSAYMATDMEKMEAVLDNP